MLLEQAHRVNPLLIQSFGIWDSDIPFVPNKRQGGVILGGKIAPIFFNTAQDSGALPIELDVSALNTGDVIHLYPYEGSLNE